ncbi:hypothetical protein [Jongsikchunia kroppenstedtii]|uniref:hypothetical protein n=1 Tax=Jongsikchunia kroppenstedtii TaxID=1121721 RepID=UPI000373FB5F|nr:hypothetical protein [Jongsikchunia kroppenstedtii]
MIDGTALAAVADRLAAAAERYDQTGADYRAGIGALREVGSGQTVAAGIAAAADTLDPAAGFALVAQHLRSLAAATHQFADAVRTAEADLAAADLAAQHELASARIADGGVDGAHTLVAAALAAADHEAIHQDLVAAGESAAQQHADPAVSPAAAALPIGALAAAGTAAASAHRTISASTDHADTDCTTHLQSRLLDFAPHVPAHLPGWHVAVALCRHADGTTETIVATPEPAPFLRPGFTLLDGEQLVGTGIEPELALLNYAQAHELSLIAVATGDASAEILDMLAERSIDVIDPADPIDV